MNGSACSTGGLAARLRLRLALLASRFRRDARSRRIVILFVAVVRVSTPFPNRHGGSPHCVRCSSRRCRLRPACRVSCSRWRWSAPVSRRGGVRLVPTLALPRARCSPPPPPPSRARPWGENKQRRHDADREDSNDEVETQEGDRDARAAVRAGLERRGRGEGLRRSLPVRRQLHGHGEADGRPAMPAPLAAVWPRRKANRRRPGRVARRASGVRRPARTRHPSRSSGARPPGPPIRWRARSRPPPAR